MDVAIGGETVYAVNCSGLLQHKGYKIQQWGLSLISIIHVFFKYWSHLAQSANFTTCLRCQVQVLFHFFFFTGVRSRFITGFNHWPPRTQTLLGGICICIVGFCFSVELALNKCLYILLLTLNMIANYHISQNVKLMILKWEKIFVVVVVVQQWWYLAFLACPEGKNPFTVKGNLDNNK